MAWGKKVRKVKKGEKGVPARAGVRTGMTPASGRIALLRTLHAGDTIQIRELIQGKSPPK